jgi:hypothetical protein
MTRPEAIYIAGPMRGVPEHNFPAFNEAARRFRRCAWKVHNPVEIGEALGNGNPDIPGGEYLRADVKAICDCTAIALLPGWERSVGARAEVALAITIGLAFYDALTVERISPPSRVVVCGGYEIAPGAVDTLDAVAEDILAWQCATFTHRTPHSITKHLLKEAAELHAEPTDDEEWADVFFLAVALVQDGTPAAPRDLIGALRAKLAKNKARTWGEPDADGVVEHVAEGVA